MEGILVLRRDHIGYILNIHVHFYFSLYTLIRFTYRANLTNLVYSDVEQGSFHPNCKSYAGMTCEMVKGEKLGGWILWGNLSMLNVSLCICKNNITLLNEIAKLISL